jgi:hypothetical protein
VPAYGAAADDHASAASGTGADAVVAYLLHPSRGEIRLMTGEREVVVHDLALARALTRHLSRGKG